MRKVEESEQLEYNRLRRSGEIFSNYVKFEGGWPESSRRESPARIRRLEQCVKQAAQFRALASTLAGVPMTIISKNSSNGWVWKAPSQALMEAT